MKPSRTEPERMDCGSCAAGRFALVRVTMRAALDDGRRTLHRLVDLHPDPLEDFVRIALRTRGGRHLGAAGWGRQLGQSRHADSAGQDEHKTGPAAPRLLSPAPPPSPQFASRTPIQAWNVVRLLGPPAADLPGCDATRLETDDEGGAGARRFHAARRAAHAVNQTADDGQSDTTPRLGGQGAASGA